MKPYNDHGHNWRRQAPDEDVQTICTHPPTPKNGADTPTTRTVASDRGEKKRLRWAGLQRGGLGRRGGGWGGYGGGVGGNLGGFLVVKHRVLPVFSRTSPFSDPPLLVVAPCLLVGSPSSLIVLSSPGVESPADRTDNPGISRRSDR